MQQLHAAADGQVAAKRGRDMMLLDQPPEGTLTLSPAPGPPWAIAGGQGARQCGVHVPGDGDGARQHRGGPTHRVRHRCVASWPASLGVAATGACLGERMTPDANCFFCPLAHCRQVGGTRPQPGGDVQGGGCAATLLMACRHVVQRRWTLVLFGRMLLAFLRHAADSAIGLPACSAHSFAPPSLHIGCLRMAMLQVGVDRDRVLLRMPATWAAIQVGAGA